MTSTPILIRNVPSQTMKAFQKKMPAASISLMLRAMITYSLSIPDEQFSVLVNKQAELELKEKELVK